MEANQKFAENVTKMCAIQLKVSRKNFEMPWSKKFHDKYLKVIKMQFFFYQTTACAIFSLIDGSAMAISGYIINTITTFYVNFHQTLVRKCKTSSWWSFFIADCIRNYFQINLYQKILVAVTKMEILSFDDFEIKFYVWLWKTAADDDQKKQ